MISGGKLGEIFASLAFSGALLAAISFFWAEASDAKRKLSWEKIGKTGFSLHIAGIFGVIITLFYLIYTHQYQYHYVWSHSSNELPVHFMISCFWEGQEGSFLLWTFWHCVLGGIIMWRGGAWSNGVLGVIALIEVILTSMILGVYVPELGANLIFVGLGLAGAAVFLFQLRKNKENPSATFSKGIQYAGLTLSAVVVLLVLKGQSGFLNQWTVSQAFSGLKTLPFTLFVLFLVGFAGVLAAFMRKNRSNPQHTGEIIAGFGLLTLAFVVAKFDPQTWKVGSTPFMLLKSVFPDEAIYLTEPDFIPSNGSGLNSLLQNYWMVIHPPTLFLGFASTVVPFGYLVAGLIKGKYRDWIRPAMPWLLFSVMILGIGIIMGGYWAYETLNFGGYWNWDPVENSSLVPWIIGVASLHAMLIHQKSKSNLKMTMVLIISTFLLVLYSTFLTRSGILGETSVHTFTDLGLSGQLLLLLMVFVLGIFLLMFLKWKEIPSKEIQSKFFSAENFLLLGALVFIFAGLEIIITTSLPVFNKIFGTSLAPPPELSLFYYQWNVWFAIAFGVLSGIAQFLWWRISKKKKLSDAIFRPFLITVIAGSIVVILTALKGMEFAFDSNFEKLIEADAAFSLGDKILNYLQYGFFHFADEILLLSSLFVVFANGDILISLLRKNRKGLKVMGGTVVHIGFGLMLLGMLFSSGYGDVVSKNLTPAELNGFPEDEKNDNVLLPVNTPRYIKGYKVTYLGKKEALAPIEKISVIEKNKDAFKIRFKDSTGDVFALVLPLDVFVKKEENREHSEVQPTNNPGMDASLPEIDLEYVENFVNSNLEYLRPSHINNRTLFGVEFESLVKPDKKFLLYPEAEVNKDMGNIIAHPSRKIYLDRDIYVHVSSIPLEEDEEPEYRYHDFQMKMGDTVRVGNTQIQLLRVSDLTQNPELKDFQIAAAAELMVSNARDTFLAKPVFLIGKENKPGMIEAEVKELFLNFAFVSIYPEKGVMQIQVQERTNPNSEWIVIKALSKPYINLLWLGTFILSFGFGIAIFRRIQENRKLSDKA